MDSVAQQRVNLIDAIAERQTTTARSRSAVLRIGRVLAVPDANNLVEVQIRDGSVFAGYHSVPAYTPAVNDVVSVLNDRGIWLILGKVAGAVWVT